MNIRPKSLRFFPNGDYTASFTVTLAPGSSSDVGGSGTYTFLGANRIKFESASNRDPGFSVVDFSIAGDELRIIDPSYTMVFRRG
jgi:hypothetical protein